MEHIDLEVLRTCAQWLAAGHRCHLITVLRTWGSSPRPIGAMMGLCADGRVVGSVSGGCIEDDLVACARSEGLARGKPQVVTYGLTADDAHRFGLPCGGTIELAIEPLSERSRLPAALELLERGQLVARRLCMLSGQVSLSAAHAQQRLEVTAQALTTVHGPCWRLLLIGAGQLSRWMAEIAQGMGYAVTVCDPRTEYTAAWSLPGVPLVHEMPDDVVQAMQLDHRCAVVALTHDPKIDDLALMEALRSPAFYVGAIGSQVNSERRRARLAEHFGFSMDELARLRGPAGLQIGSKTPPEIVISILAELTAVRNGVPLDTAVPLSALA